MALNIKSHRAHMLAKELAEQRGQSLTDAVTDALQQSLDAGRAGRTELLMAELEEVQRFVASLPDRDVRSPEEILDYDERGLPR
jgi:antitoxin VapB